MQKITPAQILAKKEKKEKIVALSAYDFSMARILDRLGVDLILVGDSLGMVLLGYSSTLPVTMEEMLHHTRAVSAGTKNALVVADMPFLSYQFSLEEALHNAGRFVKEAGAGAVKVEGGTEAARLVKKLVSSGIPVLGHIGLKPQEVLKDGYRVQGRTARERAMLLRDAQALEKNGAFAIVLEGMLPEAARAITRRVKIPTIGIGAGPHCDGQILVLHDLLGLGARPRFVKVYANLAREIEKAVRQFQLDVRKGVFPDAAHSYR